MRSVSYKPCAEYRREVNEINLTKWRRDEVEGGYGKEFAMILLTVTFLDYRLSKFVTFLKGTTTSKQETELKTFHHPFRDEWKCARSQVS